MGGKWKICFNELNIPRNINFVGRNGIPFEMKHILETRKARREVGVCVHYMVGYKGSIDNLRPEVKCNQDLF